MSRDNRNAARVIQDTLVDLPLIDRMSALVCSIIADDPRAMQAVCNSASPASWRGNCRRPNGWRSRGPCSMRSKGSMQSGIRAGGFPVPARLLRPELWPAYHRSPDASIAATNSGLDTVPKSTRPKKTSQTRPTTISPDVALGSVVRSVALRRTGLIKIVIGTPHCWTSLGLQPFY